MPRGTHFYANPSKLRIAKHGDRGGGEKGKSRRLRRRGTSAKGHRDGWMDGWGGRVVLTRVGAREGLARFPWRDEKRIRA